MKEAPKHPAEYVPFANVAAIPFTCYAYTTLALSNRITASPSIKVIGTKCENGVTTVYFVPANPATL